MTHGQLRPGKTRPAALKRLGLIAALAAMSPALLATTGRIDNLDARVLAAHNRERARVGVPALRWDAKLATDAAAWGRHLAKIGYLTHYREDPEDPDPQGENLWAGTRGYYAAEAMVGLWIAEKRHYKAGVFPANSRTGDLEDVGHYTQLIWRSSGTVGCALVRGAKDEFLVCRYAEGGNVIGEEPI